MKPEVNGEYLLGVNTEELVRLQFQHQVWKPVTEKFFNRLQVGQGWNCLDVGGGPGLVAQDLLERVGAEGNVTLLEPSGFYCDWFQQEVAGRGWKNVQSIQGMAETASLPENHFDLIFCRWVASFIPDLERFFLPLYKSLKRGGIIAVQDYYYEAISLYPHGAFNKVVDIMRSYYRSNGGNPFVAGEIPALFRKHNIKLIEFSPTCLAGGPDSAATEWAGQFFTMHLPIMSAKGVISEGEKDAILRDWNEHRNNPDMVFFSPLVVDIAGVKE